jgi:uncharacterized protein YndB with AHSA1/START domain
VTVGEYNQPMPFSLTVEREMTASPDVLFRAWTEGFGRWFAVPETVRMNAAVGEPFFFETEFEGARHPHYGRFLSLDPDRAVEMTWLTSGTLGAETVVRVRFEPAGDGAHLTLTHEGFPNEELRDLHGDAWPNVVAQQDARLR